MRNYHYNHQFQKKIREEGGGGLCSTMTFLILQGLTGGTLLSRDNESIVFYRGKDFLPTAVSLAIEKRRKYGNSTISNPKLNFDKSTPQNSSKLKMATDVSLDGHECYEKKHKDETAVSDNRAESLNVFAQNVEARLSQVCFSFLVVPSLDNFDLVV